jgi:hypothetical protein
MTTVALPISPVLAYEFTFTGMLKPAVEFGPGSSGLRMFFEATGGRVEGNRLSGSVLGGGGDWLVAGADGFARLDVRAQFRTDDGAFIYVQYPGLLEMNNLAVSALETGSETDFSDHYFRTTPRFETGDERYLWLQHHIFVSEGRFVEGGVEYRVYRVG